MCGFTLRLGPDVPDGFHTSLQYNRKSCPHVLKKLRIEILRFLDVWDPPKNLLVTKSATEMISRIGTGPYGQEPLKGWTVQ